MAKEIRQLPEETTTTTSDKVPLQKNSNNVTSYATLANLLPAGSVTNAKLDTATGEPGGAWNTWTPTWTNLTVGNGTVASNKYIKVGKVVHATYHLTLGSTSSVTGALSFTLPVTSASLTATLPIGIAYINDAATAAYMGWVHWATTTTAKLHSFNGAADSRSIQATTNKPIAAYGTGDMITFSLTYEAA